MNLTEKQMEQFGVKGTPSQIKKQHAAMLKAKADGCTPAFSKGMFSYSWRCTCPDNKHGIDQQCSDLT
jgi:hypothetical protein